MRSVCVNAVLYSIFIRRRENTRGMDAVDLNVSNIYVGDMVFKLFCWGSPLNKKNLHYYSITTQTLRSYTHVSAFTLVVY